jgi:hypothetical protein
MDPDGILVEAWRWLGDIAIVWLTIGFMIVQEGIECNGKTRVSTN